MVWLYVIVVFIHVSCAKMMDIVRKWFHSRVDIHYLTQSYGLNFVDILLIVGSFIFALTMRIISIFTFLKFHVILVRENKKASKKSK